GIIGTTWGFLSARAARDDEATQRKKAENESERALIAEREKTEELYGALLARARANRLSRRPGQRFESLQTLKRAAELARALGLSADELHELRNAVIATLALPDLYLSGPWNPWPADAFSFAFDEAHAIYARTDWQGNCSIRRVADDAEIHRL